MKIRVKFEPRDLWVGVYWKKEKRFGAYVTKDNKDFLQSYEFNIKTGEWFDIYTQVVTLYICLIPCFPICISSNKVKRVMNRLVSSQC